MQSMRFDGRAAGARVAIMVAIVQPRCNAYRITQTPRRLAPAGTRAYAVPGDASKTRVIWYTHPRANPVFTDCLRVPAGYTESVLLTFPPYKTACVSARSPDLDLNISYEKRY